MIQGINHKSTITKLDKTKLPEHWNVYFEYEKDVELSTLTKNELLEEISNEKRKEKPFINSQVVISKLLTKFGQNHSFHRQFREKHPNSDSGQTLGMQLYHIMIQDNEVWTFFKSKKSDHLSSHATYFK